MFFLILQSFFNIKCFFYFPVLVEHPPVIPPLPEPDCRRDPDCPSRHACINELCVNPCIQGSPCLPSQICRVIDDSPLRTMICECPPDQILVDDGICIKPGKKRFAVSS